MWIGVSPFSILAQERLTRPSWMKKWSWNQKILRDCMPRRLSAHNAWRPTIRFPQPKTEAVAVLDLYSLHLSSLFVVQIGATNLSLVIPYFVGRKPNIMKWCLVYLGHDAAYVSLFLFTNHLIWSATPNKIIRWLRSSRRIHAQWAPGRLAFKVEQLPEAACLHRRE